MRLSQSSGWNRRDSSGSKILITFIQLFRLLKIFFVLLRAFNYSSYSRGESLRRAFESLGPIYVKFGQLLSTRHDLLPDDMVKELEKLQDRVTPFSSETAIKIVEKSFKQPIDHLYAHFERQPLASASIAQVHAARLKTNEEVVVKILRPQIKKIIRHDISVLYLAAKLTERFWRHGKRLRPTAIVAEFEKTIYDELDLMREAANASQLRRNFDHSSMIYVPYIVWNLTCERVMTMERIYGIPISQIDTLKQAGTDMKKLAEYGVEIFFTQVFRDSFFHADMHPGNVFVDIADPRNPKYLGVDFGIMGTLSPTDQNYLAENILAFLTRNYRRVAELHIESGWVDKNTRIDEFESAIRTVSEPIFQQPLSQISFGQFLLKLFQTAERFHMTVQPQLILLQKTLFYIESLGRKLYPELNLWETAQPFMTKWMRGHRRNWRQLSENMLKTPALVFNILQKIHQQQLSTASPTVKITRKHSPWIDRIIGFCVAIAMIIGVIFYKTMQ